MIDLRQHQDALIHRIWQNDAEYFGTLGQTVRDDRFVLYTNTGLIGRYDPNHAGMLRLTEADMDAAIQHIITHYEALQMDSVIYLDAWHRPSGLAVALDKAGFRPKVAWGQYDLMAVREEVLDAPADVVVTNPANATEYAQWAALSEPDPYSDAATMLALRITECSSPAVVPTVVWCDGVPAGRCLSFVYDGVGRIECVHVDPRFRRRGLARGMVAKVTMDICAVGAVPYLFAAHAEGAQRIYQSIGYETLQPAAVMTYVRPFRA